METNLYTVRLRSNKSSIWKNMKPILRRLDMELTERCNNNCIHCCINLPADDFTAKEKELSTDEIKEILKEAASLGCFSVRYTGGEPLLREDFEDIYLYARRLGLKVLLFTNATLITKNLADLVARIPPLEKIEITVYGMRRKSYEAVTRKPGSFNAAWEGINLLLEREVPFVVKGALLPPNNKELEDFESWTAKIPWMDGQPPSYSMFFDLRNRRDSEEKNRLIRKLRLSPEEGLKVLTKRLDKYIKDKKQFCSKFLTTPGNSIFSCGSGVGGGCVDAYGHFQPCMLIRHPKTIYDLKRGSLKDALNNFFPKLRKLKAKNPEYLARCARCFLKGLCLQCPGKSWTEHGTLDTPVEYICDIGHTQARFLGLLREAEMGWEVTDWKDRIKKFVNT